MNTCTFCIFILLTICYARIQSVIHLKGGGNINLGIYVHPDWLKKNPIWSNLSNLILYVSLSERNLYRTIQIMNELFYRTLRFVHEVALKRKLVLFCDFIYNNQYIDCLIKSCSLLFYWMKISFSIIWYIYFLHQDPSPSDS